jgi:pSer/pThr/pTyr-binding forkhead associated (FHA) protein
MKVKLRILHGKLQKKEGGSMGLVTVRGPRFVIGSGPDCSMCCRSDSVSAHHCEVLVEKQRAVVRDLNSVTGTFVNDEQVDKEKILRAGDHLRIGRLEFEIVIDESTSDREKKRSRKGKKKGEPVAEKVVHLLDEADEEDRVRRLKDPELRYLHVEPPAKEPPEPEESAPKEEEKTDDKKKKKPRKKPPGKLPPKPPLKTKDSTEAAEELLRRMLKPK